MGFVQYFKRNIADPLTVLSLDFRAMAVFRFLLGGLLIVDLLMRAVDLRAHYSDFGILPRDAYIDKFSNKLHISLHLASGLVEWQALLFALTAVAALCFMIGYRTKLATIAAWILLVSMHNRNTMILNGGDVLFRSFFFWSIFLPLGARFSIDAALNIVPQAKKSLYFSAATIGITVQIAILYFATAMLKTGKEWWPEGSASYYALQLDQFVTPFGRWMGQQVDLLVPGTYAVYFLELSAPLLIVMPFFFQKIRTLTVLALMFLHFNFDLTMRLGIFPWVDIFGLVILLPSDFWDWVARKMKTGDRIDLKIYYDAECNFCRKMVLILREMLLIPETEIATAQSNPEIEALFRKENSWVVVDEKGQKHYRWQALVVVFEHIPFIGNLLRHLPLRSLGVIGNPSYKWIARHRFTMGQITSRIFPWNQTAHPVAGPLTTFLAVFFTGYIILWNLRTLPQFDVEMQEQWRRIATILRLDQKWNMFAPFPLKADGWFVIEGKLKNGESWDLLSDKPGPVSYEKPVLTSMQHTNARWRKYMMNINQKKRRTYRLYFGKYLCRKFNTETPWDQKVDKFELVFVKELSRPPGQLLTTERISLWNHDCFKRSDTTE